MSEREKVIWLKWLDLKYKSLRLLVILIVLVMLLFVIDVMLVYLFLESERNVVIDLIDVDLDVN